MAESTDILINILNDLIGSAPKPVPLHEPLFAGNEEDYVRDCIQTGWVSSVGSYVDRFEDMLAEICGTRYAVSVVNGTAAIHIALKVAGIGQGDEILMPSLTFVATANAVSYAGATPHFIDIEAQSLGICPKKLRTHLETVAVKKDGRLINTQTGQRIAAILPVHVFGFPADMDAINALAKDYDLPVIADAAEALGSGYKNKPVTSYAKISTLSFNGNKILTTGGGGALLTDDESLAKQAKHLTTTAKQPHAWKYKHDEIGYNYRLPNLNAALGCAQLEHLDAFLNEKRKLANAYEQAFAAQNIEFITEPQNTQSNYWLNTIRLEKNTDLDNTLNSLHAAGYLCRPLWEPMHTLPMYQNCPKAGLDVTEDQAARIINIPSSVMLGEKI